MVPQHKALSVLVIRKDILFGTRHIPVLRTSAILLSLFLYPRSVILSGATVDTYALSSYPSGIATNQKGNDIGYVKGLPDASHRGPLDKHGLELRRVRDNPIEHVCLCRSGQHGVDRNPARPKLIRAHERELLERRFAPAIDALGGKADGRSATGNIDDSSMVREHTRGFLHGEERSSRIEGEHAVEFFLGRLDYRLVEGYRRIVHQDIDATEPRDRCLEQTMDLSDPAHVSLDRNGASTTPFDGDDDLFGPRRTMRGVHDYRGPVFGKALCDCASNTAESAGDDRHFSR